MNKHVRPTTFLMIIGIIIIVAFVVSPFISIIQISSAQTIQQEIDFGNKTLDGLLTSTIDECQGSGSTLTDSSTLSYVSESNHTVANQYALQVVTGSSTNNYFQVVPTSVPFQSLHQNYTFEFSWKGPTGTLSTNGGIACLVFNNVGTGVFENTTGYPSISGGVNSNHAVNDAKWHVIDIVAELMFDSGTSKYYPSETLYVDGIKASGAYNLEGFVSSSTITGVSITQWGFGECYSSQTGLCSNTVYYGYAVLYNGLAINEGLPSTAGCNVYACATSSYTLTVSNTQCQNSAVGCKNITSTTTIGYDATNTALTQIDCTNTLQNNQYGCYSGISTTLVSETFTAISYSYATSTITTTQTMYRINAPDPTKAVFWIFPLIFIGLGEALAFAFVSVGSKTRLPISLDQRTLLLTMLLGAGFGTMIGTGAGIVNFMFPIVFIVLGVIYAWASR